jgi:antitoxin component of MazEF toxin-antitoxin module
MYYVMKKKTKLIKQGGSLACVLSKKALEVYGLGEGSEVEIEYEYPKIVIRAIAPTVRG